MWICEGFSASCPLVNLQRCVWDLNWIWIGLGLKNGVTAEFALSGFGDRQTRRRLHSDITEETSKHMDTKINRLTDQHWVKRRGGRAELGSLFARFTYRKITSLDFGSLGTYINRFIGQCV